MNTYDINFESGLNALRITAENETAARQKAEKRNKYQESFTVREAQIDHTLEKELAEDEAVKYGAAFPKL